MSASAACYHLPGLFEFYDFYRVFLPLFRQHRESPGGNPPGAA